MVGIIRARPGNGFARVVRVGEATPRPRGRKHHRAGGVAVNIVLSERVGSIEGSGPIAGKESGDTREGIQTTIVTIAQQGGCIFKGETTVERSVVCGDVLVTRKPEVRVEVRQEASQADFGGEDT